MGLGKGRAGLGDCAHNTQVDYAVAILKFCRYRRQRDANLSTANFNGEFVFPSLASYQAQSPTLFSLTTGDRYHPPR